MTSARAGWDFRYQPSSAGYGATRADGAASLDVVIATSDALDDETLRHALRELDPNLTVETLIARAPLFWTRVRGAASASRLQVCSLLARSRVHVRYVASGVAGAMSVPPTLHWSDDDVARGLDWPVHGPRPVPPASDYEGHWFLREGGGASVDRRLCGTGAGTRLAVIDNDSADLDQVDLDRRVCVGSIDDPKTAGHAALMVAWATHARRPDGRRFVGIAPDASVRIYAIPKPDVDVVSLPLAIARAAFDGADVIVCATYLEGTTSPMLDDALDVATHLGRSGRGTVIVFPTGRETSGAGASVHASLSLEFGDPASDPRVHCVAPGGRTGGWFLWQRARGKLRPFANRGPAVRWLAPGDDLAYPFSSRDRLFHAESSGASAIAAGVMLLILGRNPELAQHELHALLERSVDEPNAEAAPAGALADPADVLPFGRDRDGHNAKCGYGRLNAARACAIASDPVALELAAMGEPELAVAWSLRTPRPYSDDLARWASRALLARPDVAHSVRAVLRHVRLIAAATSSRTRTHTPGALARQLLVVVRELQRMPAAPEMRRELDRLAETLRVSPSVAVEDLERSLCSIFRELNGHPSMPDVRAFSTASVQS